MFENGEEVMDNNEENATYKETGHVVKVMNDTVFVKMDIEKFVLPFSPKELIKVK